MTFIFLIIFILIVLALAHMPIFETFQIFQKLEHYQNIEKEKRKKDTENVISPSQERLFKKHFSQHDNEPMLVPWKDKYCENKGLIKANTPYLCTIGKNHRFKNCRCLCPDSGLCAECWPEVSIQEVY